MGLNIYFLEKDGSDIEIESHLRITHNLNTVVAVCCEMKGIDYYEAVWRNAGSV